MKIEEVKIKEKQLTPQEVVIVVDTTFFGKSWGVVVAREPNLKINIYCKDVDKEIMAHYYYARKILENDGWIIKAVVVDGRRGMIKVFEGIPLQMCQFHQMKNVTKYITRKPETEAGQELRSVMLKLPKSTEKEFGLLLHNLFTYQKHPLLNIPNTTNSLDGPFGHLKDKVNLHHGLRKDKRYKMIREILLGEEY